MLNSDKLKCDRKYPVLYTLLYIRCCVPACTVLLARVNGIYTHDLSAVTAANVMYSTSITSHLLLTLLADQLTSNATLFHSCHTLSSCLPDHQCIPVHTLHSVQPCTAPVYLLMTAIVTWPWQTIKPSLQPFCICFLNSFYNFITCQYHSCCTGEFYPAASCALLLTSGLQHITKVATKLSTNWCFTSVNCEHSSDFASLSITSAPMPSFPHHFLSSNNITQYTIPPFSTSSVASNSRVACV